MYLVSRLTDANVKVRDGLLDVKELEHVDADGLEQWTPVLKAEFPVPADQVAAVLDRLRRHRGAVTRRLLARRAARRGRAGQPGPAARSACTSAGSGTRSAAA